MKNVYLNIKMNDRYWLKYIATTVNVNEILILPSALLLLGLLVLILCDVHLKIDKVI